MKLTEEQYEWVLRAYEKGVTLLEVKNKLRDGNYNDKMIELILEEYMKIAESQNKNILPNIEEEKEFEEKVKIFINDEDTKELSKKDKKEIKKFLKNMNNYREVMKDVIKKIVNGMKILKEKIKDEKEYKKEEEYLKKDLILRIIDSKEILDIEHPKTGEEVTAENLKTLSLDELIELMEENVEALQIVVNGKIE